MQVRSFEFAIAIIGPFRQLDAVRRCPRAVGDQIVRSGTAIGANIQEAVSAYSRKDMAAKQGIALKEARACHYWLRLVAATQPELQQATAPLLDEYNQLIAMLTASVKTLRSSNPPPLTSNL